MKVSITSGKAEGPTRLNAFDNALLDRFLVEFKKLHLTRIGLKAVLTEHNINWDSIALHEELLAEDKKMHEN